MKVLVFVAIFIFYLNSETTGLKFYQCGEMHGGLNCDDATKYTCYRPADTEYCFTCFHFNDKRDNVYDCGKEYCAYKSCGNHNNCNSTEFKITTKGNKTFGHSCCKGDFCNNLDPTALVKISSSVQSLNDNNLLYVLVVCFLSSLFVLI